MPPLRAIARSCSSVRLRACGQIACAFEWLAISGASLVRATSQNPFSFRCDRSIAIRRRLQAATSAKTGVGQTRLRYRARTGNETAPLGRMRSVGSRPDRWNAGRPHERHPASRNPCRWLQHPRNAARLPPPRPLGRPDVRDAATDAKTALGCGLDPKQARDHGHDARHGLGGVLISGARALS